MRNSSVLSGLMGVCVGDALGVPVEFSSRSDLLHSPVTTLQGYGTHNQPPGTWSDDSSLTLCLAKALCDWLPYRNSEADFYEAITDYFCRWYSQADWTPHGEVFDIGNTTAVAIKRLQQGVSPTQAGATSEGSNGNGSLMRILPLVYLYPFCDLSTLIQKVHNISSLTHGHPRSQIACGIYISIAVSLLENYSPKEAYQRGIQQVEAIYQHPPHISEMQHFRRVMGGEIFTLPMEEIRSDGYVVSTLEAALWCFCNSLSYQEAVLIAINLGEDTDTTAAVTGGLAGIYYGIEKIPATWVEQIARKEEIIALAKHLETSIN
ncbi:MAG: hypothetical protein BRC48_05715 [Cyanobacteria bacterium QS_9_48_30]|nr:MAG: hypothetical protein BRC48_05715 [Cyanobacteria bacterium QS_9_48_30]